MAGTHAHEVALLRRSAAARTLAAQQCWRCTEACPNLLHAPVGQTGLALPVEPARRSRGPESLLRVAVCPGGHRRRQVSGSAPSASFCARSVKLPVYAACTKISLEVTDIRIAQKRNLEIQLYEYYLLVFPLRRLRPRRGGAFQSLTRASTSVLGRPEHSSDMKRAPASVLPHS